MQHDWLVFVICIIRSLLSLLLPSAFVLSLPFGAVLLTSNLEPDLSNMLWSLRPFCSMPAYPTVLPATCIPPLCAGQGGARFGATGAIQQPTAGPENLHAGYYNGDIPFHHACMLA